MDADAGHAAPISENYGDIKVVGVSYERDSPVSQIDPDAVRKRYTGTSLMRKNPSIDAGHATPVCETARQGSRGCAPLSRRVQLAVFFFLVIF
jgi:hypothetical protein